MTSPVAGEPVIRTVPRLHALVDRGEVDTVGVAFTEVESLHIATD